MDSSLLVVPLGLLPVLAFLVVLLRMDTFKLLQFRFVVLVILGGVGTAVAAYFCNGYLISILGMEFTSYTYFVAPFTEEFLKALVVIFLFYINRVGFLIDAAIVGFAVGAGFAVVENLYYMYLIKDASLGVWIIRGFGTAVMHGGATAICAILAETILIRFERRWLRAFLPGIAAAVAVHAVFNRFPISPLFSTLVTVMVLPLLMTYTFRRGIGVMHEWLEVNFDNNQEVFAAINEGRFTESREGRFLLKLRDHFDSLVVADMLCYIRLFTELAMRSKTMLMAREFGMEVSADQEVLSKFKELEALERNIGSAGMLAIRPVVNLSRKGLWQLFLLKTR